MKKLAFILSTLFMVFLTSGLSSMEQIMPLEIGNTWNYRFSAGTRLSGEYTCAITEKTEISGITVFKLTYQGILYAEEYYQLYSITEEGEVLFYGDSEHGVLSPPEIIVKYPVEENFIWKTTGLGSPVEWEIAGLDEEITVPAGTFKCVHTVGTTQSGNKTDHWYAPGVGDIKIHQKSTDLIIELLNYEVK
ncbi:hypothetical protein JW890_00670 [candidate division WOR-3 bacterium]|nr:hypothetical protein [candidate division WOR-3 bacterium]